MTSTRGSLDRAGQSETPVWAGPVGVLEVGGTHVTSTLVRWDARGLHADPSRRRRLGAHWPESRLLSVLAEVAADRPLRSATRWAIAMPGPFDYARGIGRYAGVGKFDALRNVDVRGALADALRVSPDLVRFANDADAFALGEWLAGSARGSRRSVGLTLGTGVGSGWVVDGAAAHSGPGVPPDGEVHRLLINGQPLEDRVSARAIRLAYRKAAGRYTGVREIADLAESGNASAQAIFLDSFSALGRLLALRLRDFGADALVLGGSIARSWELVSRPLEQAIHQAAPEIGALRIAPATAVDGPLLGAAWATRDETMGA